jgi:hypothetical protein
VANNTYAPFGFRPIRLWNAAAPNYAINARNLAYNYGSSIALFDPVFLNTSGNTALYVNGGTTIDGIANGFEYFDPNNILSGAFHPAWNAPTLSSGVTVTAKVITDPNMVFFVQGNQNGAGIPSQTSIGKNCDVYTGSTGTPVSGSGMSQAAIDVNSIATTATLPFRIVGIMGITPGFLGQGYNVNSQYVATNGNQIFAVTLNTQDMPAGTRTGQA